jgi:hypothetical protein
MPAPSVSFTVNVCNTDAPFLEPTLRHMMRALAFAFAERLVAYDPGAPEGKYASRAVGNRRDVEQILDRLLRDNVIDRVDVIPWTAEDQEAIRQRYFGTSAGSLKDFTGAPIYQYLYALARCSGDYVLHVDSDMLFYRATERSWIFDALDFLPTQPQVIVATPRGGPPMARNWLERLTRRSFEPTLEAKWRRVTFTSTRYFLLDMARFGACLPLVPQREGEPLENSLTHTFAVRGLERWSMTTYDHWAIHPWKHDENYVKYLPELIWAVENNVYPFVRSGYQWDMRTDGKLINEWLAVLRKHGRARH